MVNQINHLHTGRFTFSIAMLNARLQGRKSGKVEKSKDKKNDGVGRWCVQIDRVPSHILSTQVRPIVTTPPCYHPLISGFNPSHMPIPRKTSWLPHKRKWPAEFRLQDRARSSKRWNGMVVSLPQIDRGPSPPSSLPAVPVAFDPTLPAGLATPVEIGSLRAT